MIQRTALFLTFYLPSSGLLFLDEPTSGLDGVSAHLLCKILRNLAHEEQCTVVCTIHQPASQIFGLFEELILLKDGEIICHGTPERVLELFEEAGVPCPAHCNPADHISTFFLLCASKPELLSDVNFAQCLRSRHLRQVKTT